PAGSGGAIAKRLRGKVRRRAGSSVRLERDRSELAVAMPGAAFNVARCVWALEDRGVRPSCCWVGEREFGLVVARDSSASAAAICFQVLASKPPVSARGAS
ncbi:MAG: hypothetical protein JXR83_15280, partial [Deltaproteobacteria bacterium]|nr:hypothetical protein [Deltaproteobacteria bacterium]